MPLRKAMLLAFIVQTHADELAAFETDRLVDKVIALALQSWTLHRSRMPTKLCHSPGCTRRYVGPAFRPEAVPSSKVAAYWLTAHSSWMRLSWYRRLVKATAGHDVPGQWQRAYRELVSDSRVMWVITGTAWDGFKTQGRGAMYVSFMNPENATEQKKVDIQYVPLTKILNNMKSPQSDENAETSETYQKIKTYDPEKSFVLLVAAGGVVSGSTITPKISPRNVFERRKTVVEPYTAKVKAPNLRIGDD